MTTTATGSGNNNNNNDDNNNKYDDTNNNEEEEDVLTFNKSPHFSLFAGEPKMIVCLFVVISQNHPTQMNCKIDS
jgi:hypothetical protein